MTDRLLAVVQGYSEGLREEAIAKRLGVSQFTVSKQLTKVGLNQRTLLDWLRDGKTPEDIVASVRPGQTVLPLDLADENKRLRQRLEESEAARETYLSALTNLRVELAQTRYDVVVMRTPIALLLALVLLGATVIALRLEPEPISTGGSALLRPELLWMSEE